MVDFVKIVIPKEKVNQLKQSKYLEFYSPLSIKTGEILDKSIAKYYGLEFIVWDGGYCELQGSLHKFKNFGKHNFDDFTLTQLFNVIRLLDKRFNLDIGAYRNKNIEFGPNLVLDFKTSKVLNSAMLAGCSEVKDVSLNATKYNYKRAIKQRLHLKMYDKRKHYIKHFNIEHEIFRYELSFKKMRDLNKIGYFCLNDLKKSSVVANIKELLINYWDSVLLFDKTIRVKELSKNFQNKKIFQWKDKEYWAELSPNARNKQKQIYNSVVENHSDNIHLQIRELISKKIDKLTSTKDDVLTENLNKDKGCFNISKIPLIDTHINYLK